jgi:type IV pilus assembly protein PilN
MLVDINLLPKKERKNFTLFIILAVLSSVILIGTLYFLIYGNALKKDEKVLKEKILQVNEKLQQEQDKLITMQETTSLEELKNAVKWAETYPIKAVEVLKHLTSLLPERGFILQYSYNEKGIIHLSVQFDTSREAAQYLQWLTDSEWVDEVSITSLGLSTTSDLPADLNNEMKNTEFIPRYIGEFDISLAREKVKEMLYIEEGGDSK